MLFFVFVLYTINRVAVSSMFIILFQISRIFFFYNRIIFFLSNITTKYIYTSCTYHHFTIFFFHGFQLEIQLTDLGIYILAWYFPLLHFFQKLQFFGLKLLKTINGSNHKTRFIRFPYKVFKIERSSSFLEKRRKSKTLNVIVFVL